MGVRRAPVATNTHTQAGGRVRNQRAQCGNRCQSGEREAPPPPALRITRTRGAELLNSGATFPRPAFAAQSSDFRSPSSLRFFLFGNQRGLFKSARAESTLSTFQLASSDGLSLSRYCRQKSALIIQPWRPPCSLPRWFAFRSLHLMAISLCSCNVQNNVFIHTPFECF